MRDGEERRTGGSGTGLAAARTDGTVPAAGPGQDGRQGQDRVELGRPRPLVAQGPTEGLAGRRQLGADAARRSGVAPARRLRQPQRRPDRSRARPTRLPLRRRQHRRRPALEAARPRKAARRLRPAGRYTGRAGDRGRRRPPRSARRTASRALPARPTEHRPARPVLDLPGSRGGVGSGGAAASPAGGNRPDGATTGPRDPTGGESRAPRHSKRTTRSARRRSTACARR